MLPAAAALRPEAPRGPAFAARPSIIDSSSDELLLERGDVVRRGQVRGVQRLPDALVERLLRLDRGGEEGLQRRRSPARSRGACRRTPHLSSLACERPLQHGVPEHLAERHVGLVALPSLACQASCPTPTCSIAASSWSRARGAWGSRPSPPPWPCSPPARGKRVLVCEVNARERVAPAARRARPPDPRSARSRPGLFTVNVTPPRGDARVRAHGAQVPGHLPRGLREPGGALLPARRALARRARDAREDPPRGARGGAAGGRAGTW